MAPRAPSVAAVRAATLLRGWGVTWPPDIAPEDRRHGHDIASGQVAAHDEPGPEGAGARGPYAVCALARPTKRKSGAPPGPGGRANRAWRLPFPNTRRLHNPGFCPVFDTKAVNFRRVQPALDAAGARTLQRER